MSKPQISVSIVSHGQAFLVASLLSDIAKKCTLELEVVLTLNIPEALPFNIQGWPFALRVLRNDTPKGFGANHNAAFGRTVAPFFCVLNPDIRIESDPMPALLSVFADSSVGVVAPRIVNPLGAVEDSARVFPTPAGIIRKALFGSSGARFSENGKIFHPDWVAGMFMMFRADVFRALGGFDDNYFLYYEDVDLCWRLVRRGLRPAVLPGVQAIHDARRSSHRNFRYLAWHARSMMRFFVKRAMAGEE